MPPKMYSVTPGAARDSSMMRTPRLLTLPLEVGLYLDYFGPYLAIY